MSIRSGIIAILIFSLLACQGRYGALKKIDQTWSELLTAKTDTEELEHLETLRSALQRASIEFSVYSQNINLFNLEDTSIISSVDLELQLPDHTILRKTGWKPRQRTHVFYLFHE